MTKDCIDLFYVEAFHNGLVKGEYSHQLNIREPRTTQELLTHIRAWIQAEKLSSSMETTQAYDVVRNIQPSTSSYPQTHIAPPPIRQHRPDYRSRLPPSVPDR